MKQQLQTIKVCGACAYPTTNGLFHTYKSDCRKQKGCNCYVNHYGIIGTGIENRLDCLVHGMKYAKRSSRKRKCQNCKNPFYTRKVYPYHVALEVPIYVRYCAVCRRPLRE